MKTRKSLAALAILLSAGIGVTACSGGNSAEGGNSSSSQEEKKGITDEQKQQIEPFLQDYYKALSDIPSDPETTPEVEKAAESLGDIEGDTLDEITKSIDEKVDDQQKKTLIDFFGKYLPMDKIDTSDLSDAEKVMMGMFLVVGGSQASAVEDMPELSVDLDKVEFGEDTAKVPASAISEKGEESDSKESESAEPSDSESAEEISYDQLKLVDGQWKIDGRSVLDKAEKLVESYN